MKLCFNVAEIEKAFGRKDMSKLTAKRITVTNSKTGKTYQTTVHVKNGEDLSKKPGKTPENIGVAAVARGDTVSFTSKGKELEGIVTDKGKMGVTIDGKGEASGIQYQIPYSDVKEVKNPVNAEDKVRPLMDKNTIKAGWRGTNGMQPESCDTIDGLIKTVEAVRGEFSGITEGVKKEFASLDPLLLKRQKLKSEDRIKEKLREDQKDNEEKGNKEVVYDKATDTYHCRTIRDCDGHTLCMKSIDDVEKLMQYFDKQPYVVRMKNNFAKPSDVGYSDINMNIKLSNGAIVELQLNTTANMVAKERYGHALYEVYRAIESNPKYKQLADLMADAQKELYKLSNKYSMKGNYPDDIPGGNIYDKEYKHEPYANAIRDKVQRALPLFKEAAANGVFNAATVEHFQNLVDYIR